MSSVSSTTPRMDGDGVTTRTRARSCEGKVAYAKKDAQAAANRLYKRTLGFYKAYRCKFCKKWHVGHRR